MSHLLHLKGSARPDCFLWNCRSLNYLSSSFNFPIYSSKRLFSSFNFSFSVSRPNQSRQLLSAVSMTQFFPEKLSIDIPEAVGRYSQAFVSSKVLIRLELARKCPNSYDLLGFLGDKLRCKSWAGIARVLWACFGERYLISSWIWLLINFREVDGMTFSYFGRFYRDSLIVKADIFWSTWPTSITFFRAKAAFFSGLRVI